MSVLNSLIGGPKAPSAPPPPPAPNPDKDRATADALNAEERKRRQVEAAASGRASTVLTGGLGDTSTATTARAVLLGG